MAVEKLKLRSNCCYCLGLHIGSVLIFLYELFRASFVTFEYFHPICYNVVYGSGLAQFAGYMSFFCMACGLITAFLTGVVIASRAYAGFAKDPLCDHFTTANSVVAFMCTTAILNTVFHIIYCILVKQQGGVCMTGYKFQGGGFVPTNQQKGMMVPILMAVIFILDSLYHYHMCEVINTLENYTNHLVDSESD